MTVPRILHIVTVHPGAPTFGAMLRTLSISRALAGMGRLRMLIVTAEDFGEEAVRRARAMFDVVDVIALHRTARRNLRERIAHETSVRYLNTVGTTVTDADRERIQRLCEEHDLVWLQRLEIANSIGIYRWPRTVIDLDDLKSQFFEHRAALEPRWLQKLVLHRRAWLARRRERDVLNRFDVAVVCSEEDRTILGNPDRVRTIPNGFERPASAPVRTAVPQVARLGFIGLVEYPPNRDGLRWFAREVWPAVRASIPDAELRIIGRGFEGSGLEGTPGFTSLGFVEDPAAEIGSWHGLIVPIQYGGGTRIKIAESFSRLCPVVSTRLGAYGYAVESERELLLADTPAQFAAACVRILQDPALGRRLAASGQELFEKEYTWEAIGRRVREAARTALGYGAASRSVAAPTRSSIE